LSIAESANYIIENHFQFTYPNFTESIFKEKITFYPDKRGVERVGFINAQIEYACHFVTSGTTKDQPRSFDKSKAEHISFMKNVLENPDERLVENNEYGKSILYLKKESDKNFVSVLRADIDEHGLARVITFMPSQKTSQIENKKASNKWLPEAFSLLSTTKPSLGENLFDAYGKQTNIKSDTKIQKASQNSNTIVLHHLRQQTKRAENVPYMCLTDFIAPKESGKQDYIGGFAVCTGIGMEKHIEKYEKDHDDYNAIMLKAMADRFAEAFTELMHEKVRRELWGYAPDEKLDPEHLIEEEYQGIRPAPGYPACPDHTEKATLFELLEVEKNTGMILTESFAMYPAAAVSGWYFSHPQSKYFGLGKIDKEQVIDYALRKNMDIDTCERWLSPALGY
jgi:hypothetical protein